MPVAREVSRRSSRRSRAARRSRPAARTAAPAPWRGRRAHPPARRAGRRRSASQLGAGADADLPDALRRQGRQIGAEAGEEQSVVLQQPQRVESALLPRERRECRPSTRTARSTRGDIRPPSLSAEAFSRTAAASAHAVRPAPLRSSLPCRRPARRARGRARAGRARCPSLPLRPTDSRTRPQGTSAASSVCSTRFRLRSRQVASAKMSTASASPEQR